MAWCPRVRFLQTVPPFPGGGGAQLQAKGLGEPGCAAPPLPRPGRGPLGLWGGEGSPDWASRPCPSCWSRPPRREERCSPERTLASGEVLGWSLLGSPLPVGRGWDLGGGMGRPRVQFHGRRALASARSHPPSGHRPRRAVPGPALPSRSLTGPLAEPRRPAAGRGAPSTILPHPRPPRCVGATCRPGVSRPRVPAGLRADTSFSCAQVLQNGFIQIKSVTGAGSVASFGAAGGRFPE